MPTPTITPAQRPPGAVASTAAYRTDPRVWLHRFGTWRPGVVLMVSDRAATVRYRPAAGRGTGVETATAADLMPRAERDELLDNSYDRAISLGSAPSAGGHA